MDYGDSFGIVTLLLTFGLASICFGVVMYVVYAIGMWKIFEKAGYEGWKGLIPFYNTYCQCEFSWHTRFFWVLLIGPFLTAIPVIGVLVGIALIVVSFLSCYYLAKAFGKDTIFAIGLFFLPFVFTLILGYGSSTYVGNQYTDTGKFF